MHKTPVSFNYIDNAAFIGGVKLSQLVEEFKTPLYVLDQTTIEENCNYFMEPLKQHYPNSEVLYAGKANLNIAIAQLINSLGLSLDVSSGGELYTAIKAGISPEKIYFHGNNKTHEELELALDYGVTLMLDNLQELENIIHLHQSEKIISVIIRLKPEIDAHTHKYIRTGQLDSKFGIDRTQAYAIIQKIVARPNLKLAGIHSHIGSQIFDKAPFFELIDILVPYMKEIKNKFGIELDVLNCGGGMGIYYSNDDNPLQINEFIADFCLKLKEKCDSEKIALPKLLFEPGRSIIGPAGITLYKVGAIKEIEGIKTYVFVDGGMADNPRPILYQAKHVFGKVIKQNKKTKTYSIAGKFCESGDILAENVSLEEVSVGDYIIVFATGAYNYSMASNYNRNCRPAMVLVNNQKAKVIVKRESYHDLTRLDIEI